MVKFYGGPYDGRTLEVDPLGYAYVNVVEEPPRAIEEPALSTLAVRPRTGRYSVYGGCALWEGWDDSRMEPKVLDVKALHPSAAPEAAIRAGMNAELDLAAPEGMVEVEALARFERLAIGQVDLLEYRMGRIYVAP